ncbi:hypothetical protein Dip510_001720 [Elusimicrobium posterum]|uniref:hypothetical protein n=1 Tax=Elusimicrobium posterum TaxID=3116653 RepID=UPI003C77C8AA
MTKKIYLLLAFAFIACAVNANDALSSAEKETSLFGFNEKTQVQTYTLETKKIIDGYLADNKNLFFTANEDLWYAPAVPCADIMKYNECFAKNKPYISLPAKMREDAEITKIEVTITPYKRVYKNLLNRNFFSVTDKKYKIQAFYSDGLVSISKEQKMTKVQLRQKFKNPSEVKYYTTALYKEENMRSLDVKTSAPRGRYGQTKFYREFREKIESYAK